MTMCPICDGLIWVGFLYGWKLFLEYVYPEWLFFACKWRSFRLAFISFDVVCLTVSLVGYMLGNNCPLSLLPYLYYLCLFIVDLYHYNQDLHYSRWRGSAFIRFVCLNGWSLNLFPFLFRYHSDAVKENIVTSLWIGGYLCSLWWNGADVSFGHFCFVYLFKIKQTSPLWLGLI